MKNSYLFSSLNKDDNFLLQSIFNNLSVGVELYDKDGIMIRINSIGIKLMGIEKKENILGCNLFDDPSLTEEIKKHAKTGNSVQCIVEYNFDAVSKYFPTYFSGIRYYDISLSPLRNKEGEVTHYLLVFQNVTDAILAKKELLRSKKEIESTMEALSKKNAEIEKKKKLQENILNSIPMPIQIKDVEDNFRYVFCNEESKRVFGTKENETIYDLINRDRADKMQKTDLEVYATGKPYFGSETVRLKDGREYETIVQKQVIEDEGKRLLLNVRWDKSLQNALERRTKALSISLEALNAYTWYYDIDGDILTCGDGFEKIKRDPSTINKMSKFLACVHPDHYERAVTALSSILNEDKEDASVEYRVDLDGDGNYKWWECRASSETVIEDGIPHRYLFGMAIDIEPHKRIELALRRKEEELKNLIRQNELVLNNINSGLAYISTDYVVQWENVSICSASLSYEAYKKGEICYKSAHNRTEPCENCVMRRAFESRQMEHIQFLLHNERFVEIFATPVINERDEMEGVVIRLDDITERQQMIAELEKAKRQAEESDKLKSAFLANMSHEIRTPLNAIVGFSDLLMTAEDVKEKENYIQIINTNNELLLKLINDILDLSKIEAGSVDLKYERFDLADYFDELYSSMQRRVTNPDVQLIMVNPFAGCMVCLDKNRLTQILTNYVTNSIKYTPKGIIEMGYEVVDEGIRLYVRDTGIGIQDEKKKKVFHRFEKLDQFAQGTGLGLSICRAIAEACGGRVGFESEHGKGSLFWAILPCEVEIRSAEASDYSQDTENVTEDNDKKAIVSEENSRKQKTILVVEDIQSNFLLVSVLLRNKYNLLHALNGQEAIEMLHAHSVDLVLMDMKMPVMDGLTATKEIRKFNTEIPIVALTAHAFESDRIAAEEAGCNGYLVKPIDKVKLMQVLREYFA